MAVPLQVLSVDSMAWVERSNLELAGYDLERELAVRPKKTDFDDDPEPIRCWVDDGGLVGLPIDWALRRGRLPENYARALRKLEFRYPSKPDPSHPSAPKGQAEFFRSMISALHERATVLAQAPTGSGKTVAVLNAIAELKQTAVIIVNTVELARQWKAEAVRHLGITEDQVGVVGDGHAQWNRPLVIVLIQTLIAKQLSARVRDSFGFVAFDEAHNLGAREFSRAMQCFPARYKIAVSATPKRKDGCSRVITDYFGQVSVHTTMEVVPLDYHLIKFSHSVVPGHLAFCKSDAKPMMWLSKHVARNEMVRDLILRKYDEGFELVVFTKFVEHAELLREMLIAQNVPSEDIGLFIGKKKAAELKRMKESCPVLIATYAMMREGVDVKRLDCAIEGLPIADVVQVAGRVRRVFPGKLRAQMWSIVDTHWKPNGGIAFLSGYATARVRRLEEAGGVTVHRSEKEKK